MKAPSFATFGNIIRKELTNSIEQIFCDINSYLFEKDHVDLEHTYIDGTKIEANANRYTWVWKKSCTKNRGKVFEKIQGIRFWYLQYAACTNFATGKSKCHGFVQNEM